MSLSVRGPEMVWGADVHTDEVATFEDNLCMHCGTRLGVERVSAVMFTVGRCDVLGFLHNAGCRDRWY